MGIVTVEESMVIMQRRDMVPFNRDATCSPSGGFTTDAHTLASIESSDRFLVSLVRVQPRPCAASDSLKATVQPLTK